MVPQGDAERLVEEESADPRVATKQGDVNPRVRILIYEITTRSCNGVTRATTEGSKMISLK